MRDESQRDERVMTLVMAALEQSAETREGYLRLACGDDPNLYAEVADRIQWEERMGGFLRETALEALDYLDRPFEPGDLVAGRFRVLSEVGRGGMGVVYEAHDEKLDRRIALKSAVRGHDNQLPPETRAAREVSHYNVCKVHDLHCAQTDAGEVEFLTMEFIDGETLSARIRREGPLTPDQARDIAHQICAGLAQAHRQGVIHGDLKCGNIILTARPEGGTRAVITDFGLAAMKLGKGDPGVTGQLRGSFDYMAPELFSGARPSVASDLYALGVIFHVMLTGKLPDPVNEPALATDASTVTLGATQTRRPIARRCEPMPRPWKAIVTRCLETVPDNRWGSAEQVAERLGTGDSSRKWVWAVPAAAAILAGALWLGRETPGPPIRLAVLPTVVEGAPIPIAQGLGVELADRLSSVRRGFVAIPPGDAQRNHVDTPEKARVALNATHVLRTRLRNSGGTIAVQASVIETGSGQTLATLQGTYSANDILVIARALTATVTGAFHLRTGVSMEALAAAAYPAYIQGINLLRRDGVSADEAMPFFQKSIELDPHSALPYAGLAEAQVQKFQRGFGLEWLDRAAQSIAKAQSLDSDSPLVLLAAGLYKQQHGQYEQAAQDFRRALELAPSDAEAWKRLATAYSGMNRPNDAIATYERAIQAQPGYYAPYFELGLFYLTRDQFSDAERLYRQVIAFAPGFARGHMNLGLALEQQGRFAEAEQSLLEALRLFETAPALTNLGALYYQQGRYGEAARYFERSVSIEPPNAVRYGDLADAYRHLGRQSEAAATYRKAQASAETEVIQNPRDPLLRARLAFISAQLGEQHAAEFEISQALSLGDDNARAIREAAFTFESLRQREKTLQILASAPAQLLEELNRQPDMKDLQEDSRFREMLTKQPHQ